MLPQRCDIVLKYQNFALIYLSCALLWRLIAGQIAGTLSPNDPCRSRTTDSYSRDFRIVPSSAVRIEMRMMGVRHRRHLTPSPRFKPGTFGSRRPFRQTANRYMLGRVRGRILLLVMWIKYRFFHRYYHLGELSLAQYNLSQISVSLKSKRGLLQLSVGHLG